jgi:hypothetical protein
MVNNCANPGCAKPLHYLRDGRIYIFDRIAKSAGSKTPERHLEHFWLCGECAGLLVLGQDARGKIRIQPKPRAIYKAAESFISATHPRKAS